MDRVKYNLLRLDMIDVKDIIDINSIKSIQSVGINEFNVGIYVADTDYHLVYWPQKPNPIADDFFFQNRFYYELLKECQDTKELITTVHDTTGLMLSVAPIMFIGKMIGFYIFISMTKGQTGEHVFDSLVESGFKAKDISVYRDYFNQLDDYNEDSFYRFLRLFESYSQITYQALDCAMAIFDIHHVFDSCLAAIMEFKQDSIYPAIRELKDAFKLDNVSVCFRAVHDGSLLFSQAYNGEFMFNSDELIKLYEEYGFFHENVEAHLKEHIGSGKAEILVYNVEVENEVIGYLCFANASGQINAELYLNDNILRMVKVYSDVYLSKLNHFRNHRMSLAFYDVLENIDLSVSVTHAETGRLLYANKKFILEETYTADGAAALTEGDLLASYTAFSQPNGEYYNPKLDKWFYCNSIITHWVDGSQANIELRLDITENKRKEETIQSLVWRNRLTNLPNRAKLNKDLKELLSHNESQGYVILMNIDLFSHVNDSYGYEFGDKLILEMVGFLRQIDEDILLYHMVGAEFVLICYKSDRITQVVKKVEERFRNPWFIETVEHFCTCSIGIASYPKDGRYPEQLIKNAGLALKMAKKGGRNKIYYFDSFEDDQFTRSLQLEYYLRFAVMRHMEYFQVYYQPIVSAYTGEVVSMEALVRWFDPEIGFVSPGEFIELAESLGLIDKIDNFVLEQACLFTRQLHEMGFDNMKFSVNLSARQLFEDTIVDDVRKTIEMTGVGFEYVSLEVTETVAINDLGKASEKLNAIRGMGINISLDDFGTGYSSLSSLKNMPISTVKIDKNFISDMHKSHYNYTFIKTIIELAHSAELIVCCEGVEKEIELQELRKLGCDLFQGFLFSRPMPADEFIKFITE